MTVCPNQLIHLQFKEDNSFFKIRIVEQKPNQFNVLAVQETLVVKDAPLAQALLGHKAGETIQFQIENKIQQVTILEIFN